MISAQDGDVDAPLPKAKETHQVIAQEDGYLTKLDALSVGVAAWRLGAGRARKEDLVQAGAGITWTAVPGDEVKKGQILFTLHTDEPARFDLALESLTAGYAVGTKDQIVKRLPLVIDRIV
jgi:thymidine phosphorylase